MGLRLHGDQWVQPSPRWLSCSTEVWPAVAVESESAIRADADRELGHVLLLTSESIAHAVASLSDVWESGGRISG